MSAQYFWEISILGHETKKEKDSDKTYVAYKVVVQDNGHSWTIERRYSDFHALNAKLLEKFPESRLPPMPSKGFPFFSFSDPKHVKERTLALEKYLRLLLKKDSPTCQCGEVIDFLDPDKKSSLNSSIEVPVVLKNRISGLPPTPPRLFILNQESIFLPDGEECFLPQFFDYISESLKYLVQVDNRISDAQSAQSKMNILDHEKERISTTIASLTDQQKVANQIIESTFSSPSQASSNTNSSNYNNFNDYSNIYNNPYTNPPNNYSNPNNYNPNPHQNYRPNFPPNPAYPPPGQYGGYRGPPSPHLPPYAPPPYGAPRGPPGPPYGPPYGPPHGPPPQNHYVVVANQPPTAPSHPGGRVATSEGTAVLVSYLETCLTRIQDAIIWESGLESTILTECANSSTWCEVQERLKWFEAECEKLIVGSLGVALPKEEKKELRKKIKSLLEQALKYYEELTEKPKHKCGLAPLSDIEHIDDCKAKLKKTIDFIKDNKKRLSGSSAEEIVAKHESKMFQVLEEIANLENATYDTPEERKGYRDKSADIKKKITSIMKKVSEFRVELQNEVAKLRNHSGDKTNLPDESSLNALLNRLEDLQANLADLSHDFSKALEIAQRNTLGGMIKEKQFEDARRVHTQNEDDMFEL